MMRKLCVKSFESLLKSLVIIFSERQKHNNICAPTGTCCGRLQSHSRWTGFWFILHWICSHGGMVGMFNFGMHAYFFFSTKQDTLSYHKYRYNWTIDQEIFKWIFQNVDDVDHFIMQCTAKSFFLHFCDKKQQLLLTSNTILSPSWSSKNICTIVDMNISENAFRIVVNVLLLHCHLFYGSILYMIYWWNRTMPSFYKTKQPSFYKNMQSAFKATSIKTELNIHSITFFRGEFGA